MLPKPILLIVGSGVAIALGNTRLGPIVAVMLVGVIAWLMLTSKTLQQAPPSPTSPTRKRLYGAITTP